MKLRVEIIRQIEVESTDPIFQELYWAYVHNGWAEDEKCNTALAILEELTGVPANPPKKTDEYILAAYEADTNVPIFEW